MIELKPLVSVIVAVYDMEEFLAETLESILASTYQRLEVMVMDDGSTDGSLAIAQRFAARDSRVVALHQSNQGVCHARNNAIRQSSGLYILPVDGDDLLKPNFIAEAVALLGAHQSTKAVVPRGEYFGGRTGEWKLPEFDRHLLARRNMIPVTALYRRTDWNQAGGYYPEIIAREDWEFWINMLKNSGHVAVTSEVGLLYRIRKGSKRITDRKFSRHVVDTLNARHPEFFERELGGPLRHHRSWSHAINRICRFVCPRRFALAPGYEHLTYYVKAMPRLFVMKWGMLIHDRRNQLRTITLDGEEYAAKSFATPKLPLRLVDGLLRPSKAQSCYNRAKMLLSWGIATPEPVAWYAERNALLLTRCYYISRKSELTHTFHSIAKGDLSPAEEEQFLIAIAQTAARLHEHNCIHRKYTPGNILFGYRPNGTPDVELIDLTHLQFREVTVEQGCANIAEHLPLTPAQRHTIIQAYIAARQIHQ